MLAPSGSLLGFLAEVPDPRSRHGRRHPLAAMLAHACCAILCGCRGYAAIAQWGRDQPIAFMHRLGYGRTPPGCGAFRALLARLDADSLEAALGRWVAHLLGPAPEGLRAVAIDGKSARGSRSATAAAVHLLAALDQATGGVLAQARVPAETNEHKAALALLAGMALDGVVVTGDAAFCQRDLCAQVVGAGGHYLLKVKEGNQPELARAIATAFQAGFSPLRPATRRGRARRGRDAR